MVTSGTISVTVVKDERTYNFSRDIVVVPRAGWFTGTPSAQPVNNGHNDKLHVPDPPKSGDILGINQVIIQPGYEVAYIDFGPNHGYSFVSRVNVGIASYRWTASPTILLMDPQFVAANCGSYPANPFGFATAAEIRDDVVRHESGLVESHYINFVTAMNAPRLNPEAVLEPLVRKETPARYRIDVRIAVENAATGIVAITGTEPCGGAPGVRNGACQFLGNRNLWPYPQTCP